MNRFLFYLYKILTSPFIGIKEFIFKIPSFFGKTTTFFLVYVFSTIALGLIGIFYKKTLDTDFLIILAVYIMIMVFAGFYYFWVNGIFDEEWKEHHQKKLREKEELFKKDTTTK